MTGLQQLWLNNNQLTGSIPTTLGGLTSILNMSLGSNLLTGSIPTQLGGLTTLHNLYLNSNQLSGTIPTALNTLINLNQLLLDNNLLTGSIPTALGALTQLHVLTLQANQLSGSLPAALGSLTNLTQLTLNSNKLLGSIPTTLTNLVNLAVGQTDLGFNGLYTSDSALLAFLSSKDPDWYETQTIAPSGVQATSLNGAHILVSWTPIAYTADTGGYKVLISQAPGGPYTFVGQTSTKMATSSDVSGLTPGVTYYFVVQTHTDAHAANANAIDSGNSAEVSATAWTQVSVLVTGTVMLSGAPLSGVEMSGLPGNPTTNALGVYTTTVAAGWSGTVTPTLSGYSFTPSSRTYTGLTTDQTGQNYTAAYVISSIRQALIDLYNATNGDGWTNNSGWKNPPLYTDGFALPGTEGTWYGVHTNGGTSLGINLNTNHLVGTLPASIGTLTSLVSLNLHTNTLSGTAARGTGEPDEPDGPSPLPKRLHGAAALDAGEPDPPFPAQSIRKPAERGDPGGPGDDGGPSGAEPLRQRIYGRSAGRAGEPRGPADPRRPCQPAERGAARLSWQSEEPDHSASEREYPERSHPDGVGRDDSAGIPLSLQ